jgi:hypothetical protein
MNPASEYALAITQLTKRPAWRASGHLCAVLKNLEQSGDVILPATTDAVWLVEEVLSIAQRLVPILVNGDRDGLDVLVAPPSRAASCRTSASAPINGAGWDRPGNASNTLLFRGSSA